MNGRLRLMMAQLNGTVGDFSGNVARITAALDKARQTDCDIVIFPEMAVCGYPPEDLLLKPQFIQESLDALQQVVEKTAGLTAVVGFVDRCDDLYNAAAIIHDGKLVDIYHKIYLPNYGVFDENRYFHPGAECPVYVIGGVKVGVNICEDIWYEGGPTTIQAASGAEVILNISASPYHAGKGLDRERMLATRATDNVAIVALVNMVGGQDELVFDGASFAFDEQGNLLARGRQFAEDEIILDLDTASVFSSRLRDPRWREESLLSQKQALPVRCLEISAANEKENRPRIAAEAVPMLSRPAEVYRALVLGTHDYIAKNGFKKVVIGLSGGIDSSLVAAIAVEALGPENVTGVLMPSPFSSPGSISDSQELGKNLGIDLITLPINEAIKNYLDILAVPFKGSRLGTAEENIQARIRGNLLMALSNKFGWLVLNTSNKSETATGYTTLYGDMAGGFAIIKDVPKTMVYELARYYNTMAGSRQIPQAIIDKVPSAELRPNQKDTDSLPPYDVLDPIIEAYVEEDKSVEQIVGLGFDAEVVRKVARLVDGSEYKRRQAAPGIKITPKAFGRDRRLPITNRFQS